MASVEEPRSCRICHAQEPPFASPCNCSGSLKYVIPRAASDKTRLLLDMLQDNTHYLAILLLPFFSAFGFYDSPAIRLLIVGIFFYSTLTHHNLSRFNHSLLHQYSIALCVIMTAGFMIKGGLQFFCRFVWPPPRTLIESFPLHEQLFRLDVDIHLFVIPVCVSNFLWIPLGVTSALVVVAMQHLLNEFSMWALLESYLPHVRVVIMGVYVCVFLLYAAALAHGIRAWTNEWREDRTLEQVVRTLKDKEV